MPSIFDTPTNSEPEPPPSQATSDDVRVGDVERQQALSVINDSYVAGRLTGEELAIRSAAAAGAVTRGQLRAVLEGLPSGQSTLADRVLQQERAGAERRAAQAQLIGHEVGRWADPRGRVRFGGGYSCRCWRLRLIRRR